MLSLSRTMRIFVYSLPTDMRRQFDGLSALVTHTLEQDVFTGDYFVFFNRSRTLCKILCWESDGYQLFAKRLARGTFQRPAFDASALSTQVDALTLTMVLGGIEVDSTTRRKRYQRPSPATRVTSSVASSRTAPTAELQLNC
jgi:transposase